MPEVVQQRPAGPPRRAPAKAPAAPPAPPAPGWKFLVFGRSGTGKTRLLCDFPKPLLLVGSEDGTASASDGRTPRLLAGGGRHALATGNPLWDLTLRGRPLGITFCHLTAAEELDELTALARDGGYATVALDTAGGVQDQVLRAVLGLDAVPVSKFRQAAKGEAWGITDKGTWGTVGTRFKEYLRPLYDLADRAGLNVLVAAHERSLGGDDEGGTSDVMLPSVGAAATPAAAGFLHGACSHVCQAFVRERVVEERTDIGTGEPITTVRRTGEAEFCLRLAPHPVFMTKFRVPPGVELPGVIPNTGYAALAALVRGNGAVGNKV